MARGPARPSQSKATKGPARGKSRRASSPIRLSRILVPIDFSEFSKNALKYAIPFARQFEASVDLLYVVEPAIYPADFSFGQVGFPNVEEELRKRGTEELETLMKKEIGRRLPARFSVRTGKPFYEINQYATEEDIDLIIIATHGHSGMEHILFGSTAEKVVRKAPCPVLVVRSGEKEFV
ncbi:MAG: universal stress protein [Ignavibacteriales bacterium]|nr:universal stress protein [Ignavibacteriales bacterium]